MNESNFAAHRLKVGFSKFRAAGSICGPDNLRRISTLADDVAKDASGDERVYAFILSKILVEIAEAHDERPVTATEVAVVWRIISQPMIRCVDLILGVEQKADQTVILNDLLDAYFKARHLQI